MSDRETQRIDKPMIFSAFETDILRAIWRREEEGSSDKASRIDLFTSSRPSSLGDDG
jgi:hypothetical protein